MVIIALFLIIYLQIVVYSPPNTCFPAAIGTTEKNLPFLRRRKSGGIYPVSIAPYQNLFAVKAYGTVFFSRNIAGVHKL